MTRAGASSYDIARSTGRCAASGRAFEPGETCIACLCESEVHDGFERCDYSIEAWESGGRPDRLYSYWKTTVPEPNQKRRVFVDDELLLNLFDRLADDDRPQRMAFRFVLGLVLQRKKLLRYAGRDTVDGREVWLLRPKGAAADDAGAVIRVFNPHLSEDDVQSVSDQLGEILSGDLD